MGKSRTNVDNLNTLNAWIVSGITYSVLPATVARLDTAQTWTASQTWNWSGFNWGANDTSAIRVSGSYGGGITLIDGAGSWTAGCQDSGAVWMLGSGPTGGGRSLRLALRNSGEAGLGGIEPLAGAGLLQLATGTTAANGIRYGDISQYRAGAHIMRFDYNDPVAQVEISNNGSGGGGSAFRALHAAPGLATANVVMYGLASATGTEAAGFGTDSNHGLAIRTAGVGRIRIGAAGELHFTGGTPVSKPTITGSRGGNAALASLLTALSNLGLVTDSTTA